MTGIDPARSIREFYVFHLRRMREQAGLSQSALGDELHVSGKLIGLVEILKRRPTIGLSKALDRCFGVDQFFVGLLPRLVEESGIPPGFLEYVEEEARASRIRSYDQFVMPGLVQTEAYAREVLRAGKQPDRLEELVAARMSRQEIFLRADPPHAVFLLDEGTLRKIAGTVAITKAQLARLLEVSREPNFEIQVLPHSAQIFPEGSFVLLSFDGEPDMGYEESVGGRGRLIEPGPLVTELAVGFEQIRAQALPAAESAELIRSVMEEM